MQGGSTRRHALRVGAVGFGASLAGCMTMIGLGTKTATSPEKEQNEVVTHFTWKDDDAEPLLELSVSYSEQLSISYSDHPEPDAYEIPLSFSVWHRQGTHLDSLKYGLKKATGSEHHVIVHWETPNRNWPETDFKKSDSGFGMTFEVPDFGEYGAGTVRSDFIAKVPTDHETINSLPIWFDAEFGLSEGIVGGYDLAVEDELEIPIQPVG